jgi:hypothetical protein
MDLLGVVTRLTPRTKVTSASIVWKASSDFIYCDLGVSLWLIEVVTLELSVARFEKAVGYDSLNAKVAEVGDGCDNAQEVSRSPEGRLN